MTGRLQRFRDRLTLEPQNMQNFALQEATRFAGVLQQWNEAHPSTNFDASRATVTNLIDSLKSYAGTENDLYKGNKETLNNAHDTFQLAMTNGSFSANLARTHQAITHTLNNLIHLEPGKRLEIPEFNEDNTPPPSMNAGQQWREILESAGLPPTLFNPHNAHFPQGGG